MAFTVRWSPRTERQLDALAKRRRHSQSDVVRDALEHYTAGQTDAAALRISPGARLRDRLPVTPHEITCSRAGTTQRAPLPRGLSYERLNALWPTSHGWKAAATIRASTSAAACPDSNAAPGGGAPADRAWRQRAHRERSGGVAHIEAFCGGRQFTSRLGSTPRESSSGGFRTLG
jgi:hypothetical protein